MFQWCIMFEWEHDSLGTISLNEDVKFDLGHISIGPLWFTGYIVWMITLYFNEGIIIEWGHYGWMILLLNEDIMVEWEHSDWIRILIGWGHYGWMRTLWVNEGMVIEWDIMTEWGYYDWIRILWLNEDIMTEWGY